MTHAHDAPTPAISDEPLVWSAEEVAALMARPFLDLLLEAQRVHRLWHHANTVELAQLVSIKTGGCPEDCGYCAQSAKFAKETGLPASKLMSREEVLQDAKRAQSAGATRYCMGAAWRGPKDRDLDAVAEMVAEVKALGLETCATLGLLSPGQAERLATAGLDFYNHNIDTSPEFYGEIITTRSFDDRLATLDAARAAGLKLCCGGILGMGESRADRASMLAALTRLDPPPESVPINQLIPIPGTPLASAQGVDEIEFARTIAAARLTAPRSVVRLSAGRTQMSDALQALCFMAGASSIFISGKLLTAPNPDEDDDRALFARLGLEAAPSSRRLDAPA